MAIKKLGSIKGVDSVLVTSADLAANVTGILPVTNGGTGQSTFTDGQLLIGNTTGNTLTKASLTGTTQQIVVTPGNGSITLSTPQNIGTSSTPQFSRLGIGAAASASSRLLVSGGIVTSNDPLLLLTQQWNNSGTTFTGIDLDIDNTASSAASKLINLKVGGVSRFNVDRDGVGVISALVAGTLNVSGSSTVGSLSSNGSPVLTTNSLIAQTQLALKGYKGGLSIDWVSATQVKVGVGTAHIESTDSIVNLTSEQTLTPTLSSTLTSGVGTGDLTFTLVSTASFPTAGRGKVDSEEFSWTGKTSTTLTGITRNLAGGSASHSSGATVTFEGFSYIYLTFSGTLEVSSTEPSGTPYYGFARSKSGDNSRRCIGFFFTNVSGSIINFSYNVVSGRFLYLTDSAVSPYRTIGPGTATGTSFVTVSAARVLPGVCRAMFIRAFNYNTTIAAGQFLSLGPVGGSRPTNTLFVVNPSTEPPTVIPVNSSREYGYVYHNAPSPGGFYGDVLGFDLSL
jgi:hypothetical protein